VRTAVERAAREVVDRAPRIVGPAPLSRDAALACALADLALYGTPPRPVGWRPTPRPPGRRAGRGRGGTRHRARVGLPDLDVGLVDSGRPGDPVGAGPPAAPRC
jgi:hypothetical protein